MDGMDSTHHFRFDLRLTFVFLPETFGPILLKWKAQHLRKGGAHHYKAEAENHPTLLGRSKISMRRGIHMFTKDPIVIVLGMWLIVVYIVVFGSLHGLSTIFGTNGKAYKWKQGYTGSAFAAMAVGVLIWFTYVPIYWHFYKRQHKLRIAARNHGVDDETKSEFMPGKDLPDPEYRLWVAIPVAPLLPISLFWLGWTSYSSISPWSGLGALALFGIAWAGIYNAVYQYILDTYGIYAGSALAIITFWRYIASGAINMVSRPMYETLGAHWTLTMLGIIAAVLTLAPFVLLEKGAAIRKKSKTAGQYTK